MKGELPAGYEHSYGYSKEEWKNKKKLDAVSIQEEVFITGITYYEVKRGLLAINATRQLAEFNGLCRRFRVL